MFEDLLRPARRRTGRALRRIPGMSSVLALKARHSLGRQICDELAEIADDKEAKLRLEDIALTMAPGDLAELYDEMRRWSSASRIARFERIAPMWRRLSNAPAPEFETHHLTSHATLFKRLEAGGDTNSSVLICFTDLMDDLFMPWVHFLLMLGDAKAMPVSVVILQAREPGAFCAGVPGLGHSLAESMSELKVRLERFDLTRRTYFGASVGGFYALRAAMLDNQAPGVSVSGRFFRMGGDVNLGAVGTADDPLLCTLSYEGDNLYCFYGADEAVDSAHVQWLKSLRPAVSTHPIKNCREHNPFITLRARRKLRSFFVGLAELAANGTRQKRFFQ